MEFTDRCRYWSVLQLVAIVQFYRGYASDSITDSAHRAQGCVGSRLDLQCPSSKIIKVTNVHLGVSGCSGIRCCIEDAGCSHKPREDHVKFIHDKCDGQRNCTIEINSIDATPCRSGWWTGRRNIDGHTFEIITYSCSVSKSRQYETDEKGGSEEESKQSTESKETKESIDEDLDKSTSTDGTTATFHSNTKADVRNGTTSDESNSQVPTVVMTIVCLVGLVAIVVLAVYIYRRRKYIQIRLFHPVATTKADSRQNESNIYANETQGTSQQDCNEDPAVYSQVVKRKSGRKESQSNPVTSDKGKAARPTVAHTTGPDVYAVVNKPSKAPKTKSSVLKTNRVGMKDFDNEGDCFTDQIYSLTTHDVADIYANEALVELPTRFVAETSAKTSSSQDNESLTVIENDLYCH